MKLILREYLASLRERGELDVVLPDLLSQMGLNVFSRPGRGTRQDGVDVAAVGAVDGEAEKVYLFSIKPGNLTRKDWNSDAVQSLRPSLDEILDAYIPSRLPAEHRGKPIVICICVGGDIQEQLRPPIKGFTEQAEAKHPGITFQEWNGDRLAGLIQDHFLREDLLPERARSHLRKSLAMLDEPDTAYKHFKNLVRKLGATEGNTDAQDLTALRQIGICLSIVFVWARDAGNLEAAYRSAEIALLHGWKIASTYFDRQSKLNLAIAEALTSLIMTYRHVSDDYLTKVVLPHVDKRHGLSSAVRSQSALDVNLRLFEVLGRLAMTGLWTYWEANKLAGQDESRIPLSRCEVCMTAITHLLNNNPVLRLPVKDDQVIEVSLALLLLSLDPRFVPFAKSWLKAMVDQCSFAYTTHGDYPCILGAYDELLEHPDKGNAEYRRNATAGSVLYPMIALWAALFDADDLYEQIQTFKAKDLEHCNFQLWFPDGSSEEHLYTNSELHGASLSPVPVDLPKDQLLQYVFAECEATPHFDELSASRYGFWPVVAVACRHHRLPIPIQLFQVFRKPGPSDAAAEAQA